MPWPTPQDYNEAVQNPQSNFDDPELRGGVPELTSLGLPRPITGGFASVYRLRCGSRDWAVRCFLREFPDQQKRYAAISRHLSTARLPYTVGFEFLPQGIRIRGLWYPILKMEWVQGESLNAYIEKHLQERAALEALANRWIAMLAALRQAGVAHGDLQHGNVLVVNHGLKLIDYDGMYVPALNGQTSHEVGHRNYQHPLRSEADFGPYLDEFSAWVVYVSLAALCAEPDLWSKVGAGDEHLLFRKEDFDKPTASATLDLLSRHSDARIRALTTQFQGLLCHAPREVPPLDFPSAPSLRSRKTVSPKRPARTANDSSAPAQAVVGGPAARVQPAWVRDHLPQQDSRKAFPVTVSRLRLGMAFLLSTAMMSVWVLPGAASLPLALLKSLALSLTMNMLLLFVGYRQEPVVGERQVLRRREREIARAIAALERSLQEQEAQKTTLLREENQRRDVLMRLKQDYEQKEGQELAVVREDLKKTRDALAERRKALTQQETEALQALRAKADPKQTALEAQIRAVERACADTLAHALERRQDAYRGEYLRHQKLRKAAIHGIGTTFKIRLRLAGVVTAADIEETYLRSIRGIGEKRIQALSAWRQGLEAQLHKSLPNTLDPEERRHLSARYERRKQKLEEKRSRLQQRLADQEAAARGEFQEQFQALEAEQSRAQARIGRDIKRIEERYARLYAEVTEALETLAAVTDAQCRQIEESMAQLRGPLPGHHWQLTEVEQQQLPFQELTFLNYLRTLLRKVP
jgi:serine/threonine protein kinase